MRQAAIEGTWWLPVFLRARVVDVLSGSDSSQRGQEFSGIDNRDVRLMGDEMIR